MIFNLVVTIQTWSLTHLKAGAQKNTVLGPVTYSHVPTSLLALSYVSRAAIAGLVTYQLRAPRGDATRAARTRRTSLQQLSRPATSCIYFLWFVTLYATRVAFLADFLLFRTSSGLPTLLTLSKQCQSFSFMDTEVKLRVERNENKAF